MKIAIDMPVLSCPKFLDVLEEFYEGLPERQALKAKLIPPDEIPQLQRDLLVHPRDMTSTLERFHGEPIELRVFDSRLTGEHYRRHIVLQAAKSRRPVEYGAIRIRLPLLDEGVRTEVLAAQAPLGGILNRHGIAYRCCPGSYFRVFSNPLICQALELDRPRWLFGRCNCLGDSSGRTIAEVVEILPPQRDPTVDAI